MFLARAATDHGQTVGGGRRVLLCPTTSCVEGVTMTESSVTLTPTVVDVLLMNDQRDYR